MDRRVFLLVGLLTALSVAPTRADDGHRKDYLRGLRAAAHRQGLAVSRQWQVLLHYRKTSRGTWRSEADGPRFFLAGPDGKTDPAAELDATLAAFAEAPRPLDPRRPEATQHAQCRFPARWAWLKSALAIDPAQIPGQPCPLFETWRQALSAERVTLMYASAYLNSPASMYGHTFFRLSRATTQGNPMLDYIINFAADIDTDNGILYAIKGVLGGFRGYFYMMPAYVKIQEYSNIESRDLWEYELSLTAEQAERMVQHAWETRSTHFDYFFFSENCSYFLLGLLEAARPSLHLSEQFTGSVIPMDTVRAILAVPGLVKTVRTRPSLRAQMLTRKRGMTGAEVATAETLVKRGGEASSLLAPFVPQRQALTLDAAYDLLRYREGLKGEPGAAFKDKERQLLILRGRTGVPPQSTGAEPATGPPESGHRSFRAGVATGVARGQAGAFEEIAIRFALHDFLDAPSGYQSDAVLEMGNLRLRIDDHNHRVLPERIDLINIVSAAPYDSWTVKSSWKVRFGGGQARQMGCADASCLEAGARAGGGLAWRPVRRGLLMATVDSEMAGGSAFRGGYSGGIGGAVNAVLQLGAVAQVQASGAYLFYFLGDGRRRPEFFVGQAWNLGRRTQVRIIGEQAGEHREGRLEIQGYF